MKITTKGSLVKTLPTSLTGSGDLNGGLGFLQKSFLDVPSVLLFHHLIVNLPFLLFFRVSARSELALVFSNHNQPTCTKNTPRFSGLPPNKRKQLA